MGIFAKRNIQKHEELTFNYNVDRYGCVSPSRLLPYWCSSFNAVIKHRYVTVASQIVWVTSVARRRRILRLWMISILMVKYTGFIRSVRANVFLALGITDEADLMELKGSKKKKGKKIDDPDFMVCRAITFFRKLPETHRKSN
jgi:[histone H3]-lysine36 N-trimethyltransferase